MNELKRLQGFPDDYAFAGTRREIQLQVGNAVPPALGAVMARAIRQQMNGDALAQELRLEQLELLSA
ncbi:MAG TPA: DNA cytosine methyltransferase [Chloroflexota bacterium]|nr:DNA cytosine methyltransferase [Chloroflexota bacterium]